MEQRYDVFTSLILNISRCVQKIKNNEMAQYGLRGNQVQCLFTLYNSEGGETLTQLCEKCDEDKGAMSRTVRKLTETGLVFVQESASQKYKNPIKLTQKGKEFGKIISDRISDMLDLSGAGISDEERNILYKTLNCISKNLSGICERYGAKYD